LRVHLPDIGALTAKIRAEYTMHFSLAAAFLLGTVGLIVRLLAGHALPWYWTALCLVLFAASMYRADESRRVFGLSVQNLYKAAQQERPRAASPPNSSSQRPGAAPAAER